MTRYSNLFLIHIPDSRNSYPETFGFWDPLCLGQVILYRSLRELKEGVKNYISKNKHIEYIILNQLPSQEEYELSDEMYKNLFRDAEPLEEMQISA